MRTTVYERLYDWARRTSGFGELAFSASVRGDAVISGDTLVYRLKHWPELPTSLRKASVFRALSVMSQRPVNRGWITRHSKMHPGDVEELFQELSTQDAVQVIDVALYTTEA